MTFQRSTGAVLLGAVMLGGCPSPPADHPPEVSIPATSAAPPDPPPSAPPVASAKPDPVPSAPSGWQRRCAAAVKKAIDEAAVQQPALRAAEVEMEREDSVKASGPMGFFLTVRWEGPGERTREPAGVWAYRAESLHGSYHVAFQKLTHEVSASIMFDGWPSPTVWPLVPGLQAGLDRCFPAK
jgi:hypothetical protein